MMEKHYAPRARVVLVEGRGSLNRMCRVARDAVRSGERVGLLLARGEPVPLPGDIPPGAATCIVLGAPGDYAAMAHNLFAALRDLDAEGVDVIVVRDPGEAGLARALRDRLRRAATERVSHG
jgi:L-threonylcarbamoyladenylate synthase